MPATARLERPVAPSTSPRPGIGGDASTSAGGALRAAGKGSPQRGHSGRGPGVSSASGLLQYGHVVVGEGMQTAVVRFQPDRPILILTGRTDWKSILRHCW